MDSSVPDSPRKKRLSIRAPCVHRRQLHRPGVYSIKASARGCGSASPERDRILDPALASRMAGRYSGHDHPISERFILRRTGPGNHQTRVNLSGRSAGSTYRSGLPTCSRWL